MKKQKGYTSSHKKEWRCRLRKKVNYRDRPVSAPFSVKNVKGWTDHIEDHLERSRLPFMLEYLNKQGFAKK